MYPPVHVSCTSTGLGAFQAPVNMGAHEADLAGRSKLQTRSWQATFHTLPSMLEALCHAPRPASPALGGQAAVLGQPPASCLLQEAEPLPLCQGSLQAMLAAQGLPPEHGRGAGGRGSLGHVAAQPPRQRTRPVMLRATQPRNWTCPRPHQCGKARPQSLAWAQQPSAQPCRPRRLPCHGVPVEACAGPLQALLGKIRAQNRGKSEV